MKFSGEKILLTNLFISLILYPFILFPLVMYAKVSMGIFPAVILIHNVILWISVVYSEKINLR